MENKASVSPEIKDELKQKLDRHEIDGAEYNRRIIELMSIKDESETDNQEYGIRKSSLRQSSIALFAGVVSLGLAIYFLGAKISDRITCAHTTCTHYGAYAIFVIPVFFNLIFISILCGLMTKNIGKTPEDFRNKIRRRKIIALVMMFSPIIVMLLPI